MKQLEIKGFKSFANETVINFEEDVIGIVGPNGSGKSNIVDAIRWVLGEQKGRELRLDQMSDVIFNGTKKRKPSGVAQVSLTFENTKNLLPTDYHTVTISRLLYRSGESEYRLNNVTCRLKDITSLFLDTGIGSNSYAIIALGMVDDILADKDNSRRRMFEQAAGISKYKVRKRETINKLKNTTADLDRVEDLLFEIDKNLKTLEKQARRTKRYFDLKAKYKQLSVDLALMKISSLRVKHHELKSQLEQEQDRYRQLEVEVRKLESLLEQEKKANLDKEKMLSDRQRELNNLVGEIRSMENDKRMLEQRLQFSERNKVKLSEEMQAADQRITQLEEDIEHYRSELNTEKRVEARLEFELTEAENKLEKIREKHSSIKAELDEIVESQQQIERSIFELEKQKAIHANQIHNHRQERAQSIGSIEQRGTEVTALRERLQELEAREEKKSKEVDSLEQAEEQRQEALQEAESRLEDLNAKIVAVNRDLDAKRNEYKLTKSMVENLEGFPESIRFLSSSKDWNKEAPLLSDLLYVKEAYRVAIENYLEPYLNYYVVANLEEAHKAIQLLSRTQKGKANFFILDAFEDYVPPMTLLPDTLRATDLVETDPVYRKLCNYLLGNVLLTEREEVQGPMPENELVLLSKSGRFIQRRFSVSGGSIGLFEGKKIGRKKNLEILAKAIRKAEKTSNQLSTEYYTVKEKIDGLKAKRNTLQIQQVRNELNKLGQEKVSLRTRLENFESFIREANERTAQLDQLIQDLESTIQDIEEQLSHKKDKITGIKDQIASMDGSYREAAEQLSNASSAFNDKNIQFIRQQNKVNTLQRELSFREKQLEENKSTLSTNNEAIEETEGEILGVKKDIAELEEALLKAYGQRKEREASLTEAEQVYFKARGSINEIEDKLRQVNKTQQDAQILINRLKDKFNDVKYEISSVAQRLRIEFEIDINEIINKDKPETEMPEAELEEKVTRLKGRLDNYGEINPMAVEAYDEMKERHETITQQRDDILEAKESLLKTIEEIEETATAQFLQAFDEARGYFIDVFRSLFTEDDGCDLMLLEPENPLESKIEIVAQPKGKRPQTINQLSGGEKTLTATALLFALYLLKPAPFCIFDEVDAPLDDANIVKFNKIIKKFSKDSQFIIVTHNKLTMAAVDVIYGVYMAEQGVSGVSQVDFRDFEHTTTFEVSRN